MIFDFVFEFYKLMILIGITSIAVMVYRIAYKARVVLKKAEDMLNKSTCETTCSSCTSTTDSDTTTVDKLKYPYITLNPDTQLCPSDRSVLPPPEMGENFYIKNQDRINLRLKTDISVTYKGVKLVVVGNSETDSIRMCDFEPEVNNSHGDMFRIALDQGTPVTIDESHDNIGLTKRLEARQTFNVFPGSTVTIPTGVEFYVKGGKYTKFVTEGSMVCTLNPPLKKEKNDMMRINTRS